MTSTTLLGSFPVRLRCFAVANGRTCQQFIAARRLKNAGEIFAFVEEHSSPELLGDKAMLVVPQQYLPTDLLINNPDFKRFCRAIGFTHPVHELFESRSRGELPTSLEAAGTASHSYCSGFPITMPVNRVDLSTAWSFSHAEIASFLSPELLRFTGKMIIVNTKDWQGQQITLNNYPDIAMELVRILAASPQFAAPREDLN